MVKNKRAQKINYKEVVLKTIYATAIISVAIVAPNALQMFSVFKKRNNWSKDRFEIDRKTKKLLDQGFVYWQGSKTSKTKLALTQKGIIELFKFKDVLVKKEKWDKKWRVVIFDIPSKKNKSRNILRLNLRQIGFVQLQKSVWVYPYRCSELIKLVKNHFHLGKEVTYMIVDKIEDDLQLKNKFKLK